jgi:hypothetical protein
MLFVSAGSHLLVHDKEGKDYMLWWENCWYTVGLLVGGGAEVVACGSLVTFCDNEEVVDFGLEGERLSALLVQSGLGFFLCIMLP